MIRHVVMFTWNDGVAGELLGQFEEALTQLASLDAVAAYHFGPNVGANENNWDYAVVGDFATIDDYNTYATDAFHLDMIERLLKPNISGRSAVQYEFEST